MIEHPSPNDIYEHLRTVRWAWHTDGWRTLAEIAGHFESPNWVLLLQPVEVLMTTGCVERRVEDDGPSLYRAFV